MQSAVAVEKQIKIRPRGNWVVIKKVIREEVIQDGVIVPGAENLITKDDRSQRGIVVALSKSAGRDRWGSEIPWDIAIGDTVIFTNYPMDIPAVEELTGETNLVLVQADEVFAVAEEV